MIQNGYKLKTNPIVVKKLRSKLKVMETQSRFKLWIEALIHNIFY